MRIEIKKLQRSMGVTSIYVTHDQTEAMTLADRLAVINNGQVEQMGAPMELYSDPQTLFVAAFIGSPQINLIPARFEKPNLVSGSLKLKGFKDLPADKDLILGIRPDHLAINNRGALKMRVDLVEQHGADNLIYGALQDTKGDDNEELEICLKADQATHPEIEETIKLGFDTSEAFVFEKETGKRLV